MQADPLTLTPLQGPVFDRSLGIDDSGAQTPTSSLKGLRVYRADRGALPVEVQPPSSPRKYWRRRGIGEWLVERLNERSRTLVGIDHGFSFPVEYFERYGLPLDWPAFLEDFHRHWPTDEDRMKVDFVRKGDRGHGATRSGDSRWMRLTERRARTAKSVFRFDVPGSVAKSTHAGLPWLLYVRRHAAMRVHFWPFDGWRCRRDAQSSRKCIRPCGAGTSLSRDGLRINMMRIPLPHGCGIPTARG